MLQLSESSPLVKAKRSTSVMEARLVISDFSSSEIKLKSISNPIVVNIDGWLDHILIKKREMIEISEIELFLFLYRCEESAFHVLNRIFKWVKKYHDTKKAEWVADQADIFVTTWIHCHWNDFNDEDTLVLFKKILKYIKMIIPNPKLLDAKAFLEVKWRDIPNSMENQVNIDWESDISNFAKQITAYQFKLFSKLNKEDCISILNQKRLVEDSEIYNLVHKTKILGHWVSSDVLLKSTHKEREFKIRNFINLAKHCLKYGNENGYFAIWSGLLSFEIYRLKKSWKKITSDKSINAEVQQAISDFQYTSNLDKKRKPYVYSIYDFLKNMQGMLVSITFPLDLNDISPIFHLVNIVHSIKYCPYMLKPEHESFLENLSYFPLAERKKRSIIYEPEGRASVIKNFDIPFFDFDEEQHDFNEISETTYKVPEFHVVHDDIFERVDSNSVLMRETYCIRNYDIQDSLLYSMDSAIIVGGKLKALIHHILQTMSDENSYIALTTCVHHFHRWKNIFNLFREDEDCHYVEYLKYVFQNKWHLGMSEDVKVELISILETQYFPKMNNRRKTWFLNAINHDTSTIGDGVCGEIFGVFESKEIAQTLCTVAHYLMHDVTPQEYLQYGIDNTVTGNLFVYTNWLKNLQSFIKKSVLSSDNQKTAIIYFMKLAIYLYRFRNFACLWAIIASLNSFTIGGMQEWEEIQETSKYFKEYWKTVRLLLGNVTDYKKRTTKDNPFIPFLGFHLQDLEYLGTVKKKVSIDESIYANWKIFQAYSSIFHYLYPAEKYTYETIPELFDLLKHIPQRESKTIENEPIRTFKLTPKAKKDAQKNGIDLDTCDMEILYRIDSFFFDSSKTITEDPSESKDELKKANRWKSDIIEYSNTKVNISATGQLSKRYKKMKPIGKGGYASVFIAKDVAMNEDVAIKKLDHKIEKRQNNNYIEAGYLMLLKHPNLLNFFDSYCIPTQNEYWIVTEMINGTTLSTLLKLNSLSDNVVAFLAKQILEGLIYLHNRKLLHRDLKSSNIMLDLEGNLKIIDFGLMQDITDNFPKTLAGSPFWMAPEMIVGKRYGLAADVWSFGVCVLEMLLQEPPFRESGLLCMYNVATTGFQKLPKFDTLSTLAKRFLACTFQKKPSLRWTVQELIQHEFIEGSQHIVLKDFQESLYKSIVATKVVNLGF